MREIMNSRRTLLSLIFLPLIMLLLLGAVCAAQMPQMPAEQTATVFGQSIHFFEAGQGPAVILLHGLGANAGMWVANIGALSEHNHVIALDQIGFGHSDKPLIDYRIATFVDFLYGFMQAQKIAKATLVGNSLGGWIALDFALQHPEMVEKLVLVDAAGLSFETTPPTVNLNPASLDDTKKVLGVVFYNQAMVTDQAAAAVFARHLKDNDGYTIRRVIDGFTASNQLEDTKLSSVHVPTLVVWGANDALLPLSMGERLHAGISGSKLVTFKECGHIPQLEKPEEFNRALLDFLSPAQ
jgi:2-hydroxy-6-oxonona-2,4-dienedioate hydrolase